MNQKRTKGFTLIELLAVIVILAIIALIAVPVILNIIDKANKSAFKDTAYGIINAAELYFAEQQLDVNGMKEDKNFDLSTSTELQLKGDVPNGNILITKEGKTALAVQNGRYCIIKGVDDEDITVIENYTTCELPSEKTTLPIEWYAGSDVSKLVKVKDEEGNDLYYKISDYAEPIERLKGVVAEYDDGEENFTLTLSIESEELLVPSIDGNSYKILDGIILINLIPDNTINGITFSEPGAYVLSVIVEDISVSVGGKLKPTTVVIGKNNIKWDGSTKGLECALSVEDMWCKVSDTIPSTDIESYKKLIVYDVDDAKYLEYDDKDLFEFIKGTNGANIGLMHDNDVAIIFEDENLPSTSGLSKGVWFYKHIDSQSGKIDVYTSEIQFE